MERKRVNTKMIVSRILGLVFPGVFFVLSVVMIPKSVYAGEDFFGYLSGSEVLPKQAKELELQNTARWDKGIGSYRAFDSEIEMEYGVSNRFTVSGALKGQAIKTSGILIDAYIPKDESYGTRLSGVEAKAKYNILSAAQDPLGLTVSFSVDHNWLDNHSGQDKRTLSTETGLQLQKYFMEGRMVWVGNLAHENTIADRAPIADLPPNFEWPTDPEVEIEFTAGTGLTYRVVKNWYTGLETQYQEERETEVGQERWSWFAGPSLHYGSQKWWTTFTWLSQIRGGGERYDGQTGHYHLIEKTKQEIRLKLGFNF